MDDDQKSRLGAADIARDILAYHVENFGEIPGHDVILRIIAHNLLIAAKKGTCAEWGMLLVKHGGVSCMTCDGEFIPSPEIAH